MYTERLLLEVNASKLGWTVVRPPLVRGRSGVDHSFTFLASSGSLKYGFDVYDSVTETDVLKSYIKGYDAGTSVQIICLQGEATIGAKQLAREYNMKILSEADLVPYFQQMLLRKGAKAEGGLRLTV